MRLSLRNSSASRSRSRSLRVTSAFFFPFGGYTNGCSQFSREGSSLRGRLLDASIISSSCCLIDISLSRVERRPAERVCLSDSAFGWNFLTGISISFWSSLSFEADHSVLEPLSPPLDVVAVSLYLVSELRILPNQTVLLPLIWGFPLLFGIIGVSLQCG